MRVCSVSIAASAASASAAHLLLKMLLLLSLPTTAPTAAGAEAEAEAPRAQAQSGRSNAEFLGAKSVRGRTSDALSAASTAGSAVCRHAVSLEYSGSRLMTSHRLEGSPPRSGREEADAKRGGRQHNSSNKAVAAVAAAAAVVLCLLRVVMTWEQHVLPVVIHEGDGNSPVECGRFLRLRWLHCIGQRSPRDLLRSALSSMPRLNPLSRHILGDFTSQLQLSWYRSVRHVYSYEYRFSVSRS